MVVWGDRRGQVRGSGFFIQTVVGPVERVGERRESVGSPWATRERCPRAAHTARRARAGPRRGLVHNSTGLPPGALRRALLRGAAPFAPQGSEQLVARGQNLSRGVEVALRMGERVERLEAHPGLEEAGRVGQ